MKSYTESNTNEKLTQKRDKNKFKVADKRYGYEKSSLNRNRYQNRFLRRPISTRSYQIKYPVSVQQYRRFTKSYTKNYYSKLNKRVKDTNNLARNNNNYRTTYRFNTKNVVNNERGNKSLKYRRFLKYFQKVETNSDSIDYERLLKANLDDAMFHRENISQIMDRRRHLERSRKISKRQF